MNLSAPFVRRPVATLLLAAGVVLLGLASYRELPVAALPNVDRPTIAVVAQLPGASPDTIAASVAQPLEHELATIAGIVQMRAFSAPSSVQIIIQFDLTRDIDAAAADVQAAINAALPNLPRLPQPPFYFKSNPSGFPVIALAMTSDVSPPGDVYEQADTVVTRKLSQLKGVSKVLVSGAERRAVRIRVSPRRAAAMNLGFEQIRAAIWRATQNRPKGAIAIGAKSWTLEVNDQLLRAADYDSLVVAWRNGAAVRLSDIAEISESVINTRVAGWFGDRRGVVLYVYKQLDANVVETVENVKQTLPDLSHWLPPSTKVHIVFDRTTLIRSSVANVRETVLIAVVLAAVVVGLFLRRLAATAIPTIAIPVALAATLTAMHAAGYSLDNLSLMAITMSVAFVVDDGIIVVENVVRLIDEGQSALEAALLSARQMGFTIIAIAAALVSALLPVLFMPDVVGRYFREFGMTLAIAIVASTLVSLTLTPMLCARMLRRAKAAPAQAGSLTVTLYLRTLDWSLRHRRIVCASLPVTLLLAAGTYLILPKGFMPTQDTGILMVKTITISNVSFAAMEELQRQVARDILSDPAVDGLSSHIGGIGQPLSVGSLVVNLKPIDQRPPISEVIERLRQKLANVQGIRAFFIPLQDLNITIGGASRYQYTLVGGDPAQVWRFGQAMRLLMLRMKSITAVISDGENSGLQAGLLFDRQHAAALGVTPAAIDNALYDAFGQRQIATLYFPTNYSRIVLEADPSAGAGLAALDNLYVSSTSGRQIPLQAVSRPERARAQMWMMHTDQIPSLTISFDTRTGFSIAQAIDEILAAQAGLQMPDEIRAGFKGEAGEASKTGGMQAMLVLAALVAIYLVLGALYESYAHPFTILSTLPSAVLGALIALHLANMQFTLVALIACLMLVGMVMKNAIMMVDFALAIERGQGLSPVLAIRQAARQRVRPIVMTTLVATLSALPLAVGTGPGFELRQPLGIASVGGLIVCQLLTLYTTPVVYVVVSRARSHLWRGSKAKERVARDGLYPG